MGGIIKMNDMLLLLKHIVIVKSFIITGRADGQAERRTDQGMCMPMNIDT